MNDLIEIGMKVDSSDFVKAAADTKGFELAVAKMVQTILRENRVLKASSKASADARAEAEQRAIQKQIEAEQKLTATKEREAAKQKAIADRQAKAEMDAYVRTTIAAEKAAATRAKATQANVGGNLGLGSTNAIGNGAGFGAMEGEIERLRVKYDSAYAASKLFEEQSKELSFAMLNQAGNADTLKAELDKLQAEYAAFSAGTTDITNRFNQQAAAVEQSRKGVNKWGLLVQQSGYQAGDFLVQIQSGTNAFVAFGQQATQLVGILPMFAAELGISSLALGGITLGLSIAIPLITAIGAYFMRTGEEAKQGAKGIDIYKAALDSLKSTVQSTQVELDKLTFGTSDAEVAVARRAMQTAQEELQALQAASMRTTARGIIFDPNAEQEAAIKAATEGFRDLTIELDKLLFKQEALSEAQRMLTGGLSVAGGLQRAAVLSKQEELRAAKDYEQSLIRAYGYYAKTRVEADKIAAANAKANEGTYADAQFAKQAAIIAFYKEQEEAENKAGEKAEYLRQVFHMLAGETSSISTGIKPLPEILDKAAIAAYKLAAAMADTKTAANAVLSSMIQVEAARSRKQGQVQAAAAGFVGRPELDTVGNRAAVNAARAAILEKNNAPETGGGDKKDPLAELQKQIALQEELNGKTEAEQKVRQALGDSWANYSPTVIKGLEEQIQKQMDLEAQLKSQQGVWDTVQSSMEDAFMTMDDGTKSAKDAFKSMAAAIIKELYNVLVVQQLVGSFNASTGQGAGITGFLGKALTGMFKADGGPVSAGQPYIVGERGPEMIIPKSSGMVLTNGQTKAALGGSSNESYTVHNNISVTGSDSVMVRQEIAKMIPQISSATKAAMIDAKRRGGQMGNAFR